MPSDDYTVIGGGLKLKGSKPTGVTKKKKKDKIPKDGASTLISKDSKDTEGESKSAIHKALEDEDTDMKYRMEEDKAKMRELDPRDNDGKTASERQFEEMRRKRLHDRLAREGIKTHKQRVEELNKYLSTLSEHHDMPKIGPG